MLWRGSELKLGLQEAQAKPIVAARAAIEFMLLIRRRKKVSGALRIRG